MRKDSYRMVEGKLEQLLCVICQIKNIQSTSAKILSSHVIIISVSSVSTTSATSFIMVTKEGGGIGRIRVFEEKVGTC